MKAPLNLASNPYRQRAVPWTLAVLIAAGSLLALWWIISESNRINARADSVGRDVHGFEQQEKLIQQQSAAINEGLTPGERETLQAAHALVDHKRFSWSKLFADLEAALPGNVRVSRINVRDIAFTGGQAVAELTLTVVGKNDSDVTSMITDMDRAGVFEAEPVAQALQKGRNESGAEWTLLVRYSPRNGSGAGRVAAKTDRGAATMSQPSAQGSP